MDDAEAAVSLQTVRMRTIDFRDYTYYADSAFRGSQLVSQKKKIRAREPKYHWLKLLIILRFSSSDSTYPIRSNKLPTHLSSLIFRPGSNVYASITEVWETYNFSQMSSIVDVRFVREPLPSLASLAHLRILLNPAI